MNIPTLTPRAAALGSAGAWTFNFLCQMYGMLSTPNMKDVADKYHAFLSPHPFAIALFFFPQSCLQVYWIYKLYRSSQSNLSLESDAQDGEDSEAVSYSPIFILGNVCIGLWMVFWNSEHLGISDIFVNINSIAQLYYVFVVLAPINNDNKVTHLVAKTFAGIGVLDVVDNASSAFANYEFDSFTPGLVSYILTLGAAAGLGFVCDPILGACIVYDFLALFAGQIGRGFWAFILLISAGISGTLVVFKALRERETYQSLLSGETGNVI